MPQRYRITLAYRGTRYYGWQTQSVTRYYKGPIPAPGHGIPTIQETVRRGIEYVVGHPINLVGSSRTDTGVHAKAQIAHFDTDHVHIPPEGIRRAANARIPDDILIRKIEPVPPTFDAIVSTISKRYQYAIWNEEDRNPLLAELVWHRRTILNLDAMRQAATGFVGTHDFASFARPGHGRDNTVRTILDCSIHRRGKLLVIGVEGNGFLWNMVRIMVGTLVQVGMGNLPPDHVPRMLASRQRLAAGPTAPPHGLYLQWVKTQA